MDGAKPSAASVRRASASWATCRRTTSSGTRRSGRRAFWARQRSRGTSKTTATAGRPASRASGGGRAAAAVRFVASTTVRRPRRSRARATAWSSRKASRGRRLVRGVAGHHGAEGVRGEHRIRPEPLAGPGGLAAAGGADEEDERIRRPVGSVLLGLLRHARGQPGGRPALERAGLQPRRQRAHVGDARLDAGSSERAAATAVSMSVRQRMPSATAAWRMAAASSTAPRAARAC